MTKTCEARIAYEPGPWGERPVYCGQSVGLRYYFAADGEKHFHCSKPGHRERVEAQVRRMTRVPERCHCGSHLTPRGCENADCGNWEGPWAA